MAESLHASSALTDDGWRVKVRGELDMLAGPQLVALVTGLEPAADVQLEMSDIDFIDSRGLAALVELSKLFAARSKQFRIVAPSPAVRRLLDITRTGPHLLAGPDV